MQSGDYHGQMSNDNFKQWMLRKTSSKFATKQYHTNVENRTPTKYSTKKSHDRQAKKQRNTLREKDGPLEDDLSLDISTGDSDSEDTETAERVNYR
ncbi:hypothetical protein NPIL_237001 [Nephila pilipes]|uniref:Uncharacterized protein n=1 Tax=Nephila pilipes TaxID=299642 RepID=A0A8X6MPB8_NEPPI|nr:hypothetical protein NPIL_237001 [Nephila pilipes]